MYCRGDSTSVEHNTEVLTGGLGLTVVTEKRSIWWKSKYSRV